ncbi:uncharacterized protein LOC125450544 [Stegostoma tigrinum]|uniref:uncharacterized protein LOC125450544 n=1 Tax=Stegostoma tigrinum TaxID=3053191 RepID=UPI0028708A6B|nr:uncharacterized protein LOC125450544 [Stegostoma tigrinum]
MATSSFSRRSGGQEDASSCRHVRRKGCAEAGRRINDGVLHGSRACRRIKDGRHPMALRGRRARVVRVQPMVESKMATAHADTANAGVGRGRHNAATAEIIKDGATAEVSENMGSWASVFTAFTRSCVQQTLGVTHGNQREAGDGSILGKERTTESTCITPSLHLRVVDANGDVGDAPWHRRSSECRWEPARGRVNALPPPPGAV